MSDLEFLDITIESTAEELPTPASRFTLAKANGSLDPFCGRCVVLDFSDRLNLLVDAEVLKSELEKILPGQTEPPAIKRFLIKTKTKDYMNMATLDWPSCLKLLSQFGAVLVGCDEGINEALSDSKLSTLVNLNLSAVKGGTTGMLVSGPEKISGESLVPCRAVLIDL